MGANETKRKQQNISIDKNVIISVAKQAKLQLTDSEIKQFSNDLTDILKTFSILDEIDVENTQPSFRPIEERNHLREDIAKSSISQSEALQFTKDSQDGYFIGPRTVDNK